MSVNFIESIKNVHSHYNKLNVLGYLTLFFLFNTVPFILGKYINNILYYYIVTLIIWFFILCIHSTAQNNAVHNREGVFPGIKDIFNNIGAFLKNGLCMLIFVFLQYFIFLILLLAFNYLLAQSLGFTGDFKEMMNNFVSYLYTTSHSGDYSIFLKEIALTLIISIIMLIAFIGNYSNFIYDLKFGSLFNFLRGFKFLAAAKGDTPILIMEAILFFIALAVIMGIFTIILAIILIITGVISHTNPNGFDYTWLNIIVSFIYTYLGGFLCMYLFDLVAQYIRTNQIQEEQNP